MKIYVVSLLILVSLCMNGCEDEPVTNSMVKTDSKVAPLKKQLKKKINKQAETKQPTVIKKKKLKQKLVKIIARKQAVKVNQKKEVKEKQVESENTPDLTEPDLAKNPLDLTLPFTISSTNSDGRVQINKKTAYLPDLFGNKKDKNDNSFQMVGKFIKRDEVALGKETNADGAGIDFKLSH